MKKTNIKLKLNSIKKYLKLNLNGNILLKSLLCGLILTVAISLAGFEKECNGIRENVLRMHVIANSDTDEDQALKLEVRDNILEASNEVFKNCKTEEEAVNTAKENIEIFENIAKNTVKNSGKQYDVAVSVGDAYFNNREYDGFTLPAGEYEAVKVVIGEGKGKNWWCVMFPQVCLPAASNRDISETLDEKQTDIVKNKSKYEVRFKIVEWVEGLKNKLKSGK